MDLVEAMQERHMVRKYKNIPLSNDIIENLNNRIVEHHNRYQLHMKLMCNDTHALNSLAKIIFARNVKNYIILAGDDIDGLDERLGFSGADLMLYAQTLGLNSWYVGGMFNHHVKQFVDNKKVLGIIAIGYGKNQGVAHKSKIAADVSSYQGNTPDWFNKGVEASLLAPTALNKQDYKIIGRENKVNIINDNGIYTGVNRGLIKYHFELGAEKDNFIWEDET